MNQISLSTVLIRLFGLYYLLFRVIAQGVAGFLIPNWLGNLLFTDNFSFSIFLSTVGVVFLQLLVSLFAIIYAKRISLFLFKENSNLILEGEVNPKGLLQIGIVLIGVFGLLRSFPGTVTGLYDWFQVRAENSYVGTQDTYSQFPLLAENLLTFVFAVILIFSAGKITSRLTRRNESI